MSQLIDFVEKNPEPKRLADYFNEHKLSIVIWPEAFNILRLPVELEWKQVEFNEKNKRSVSDSRGIYVFQISIKCAKLPNIHVHAYTGKASNLRRRYGNYITEKNKGAKRQKFVKLFQNWGDCLEFHYAEVNDENIKLRDIEKSLNDAAVPCFVTNDFTAQVKRVVTTLRM